MPSRDAPLTALHPDWWIVVGPVTKAPAHQAGEHAGSPDTASCYHMWRASLHMRTPDLHCDEACDEERRRPRRGAMILPFPHGYFAPTPLQRKKREMIGCIKNHVPLEIEGLEAFYPSMLATASRWGRGTRTLMAPIVTAPSGRLSSSIVARYSFLCLSPPSATAP